MVTLPPDPMQQAAAAREEARLRLAQEAAARSAANSPSPNERQLREKLLAAQVQSAQAAAQKAVSGNAGAKIGDAKTQQRMANLNALGKQIGHVRGLWEKNLKGGMPNWIAGNVPDGLRPENGAFESAAAGLGEIGLAAFRVPGVGSQSDAELRQFVNANTPQPGDSDAKIEEKLRNLQTRLDATMQEMGGEQAGIVSTPNMAVSDGQTQDKLDPETSRQMDAMVRAGRSDDEIGGFLASRNYPMPPKEQLDAWRTYLRENPGFKGSSSQAIERSPVGGMSSALGINPNSGLGAYGVASANALTAGTLDEMAGGNSQQAKELLRQNYPGASFAGDITGSALGMTGANAGLRFAGGRLAGLATRGGGIGGDMLYGSALGAGESNEDRLGGALTGAAAAGAGNLVGRGIVSGTGRAARGISDPAVNFLAERGIRMTPGQIMGQGGAVGRGIRSVEDTLESVPFLGSAIRSRKAEGLQDFNREAFKDALAPIGEQVQGTIGQDAIGEAQDLVSNAYGKALGGQMMRADLPFAQEAIKAARMGSSIPTMGDQFDYIVKNKLGPLWLSNKRIDGPGFQASMQTTAKAAKDFSGQGAMGSEAADFMGDLRNAYTGLANRQAPEVMPALNAANAANRNVSVLGDAVRGAVNNSVDSGMFSPAQLGRASVNNTVKFGGKRAASRGDVPFAELQQAGQAVLPNTIPNSGTTDRALATAVLPAALGGAAAGSEYFNLPAPVTGTLAGLGILSTKKGNAALQKLMTSRSPEVRRLGEELLLRSRYGGMFGASVGAPMVVGP
jgi:hypothetical protein